MDLKERFGRLVAANRRRKGWTQADLAEACDLSEDMVARVEAGATGSSFATIEKFANALDVDASELFNAQANRSKQRKTVIDFASRLSALSDEELAWLTELMRVALRRPR